MDILISNRAERLSWQPISTVFLVAAIGFIACQFKETYVLASLVVVAWGVIRSRWTAYGLLIVYSLASTWVVVPAIVDYLQWPPAKASLFWAVALPTTVLPWLLLHRSDTKLIEVRLAILLCLSFLPPIGFVQFASPFVGTSLLLAGEGWMSILAGVLMCGAFIRLYNSRMKFLIVPLAGCVLLSHLFLTESKQIPGWRSVDTAVKVGGLQHTIEGSLAALGEAKKVARQEKPSVVVLGESTGGYSVSASEMMLGSVLKHTVVVAGGRVDNKQALFVWSKDGSANVYHQRLRPVLLEHMDGDAHGNKTVVIDGLKVAPLICYEGAVPYTIVSALTKRPEALLSIANFSFSRNDAYFERVLRAHMGAWGQIFDIPTVIAVNSRSIRNV